MFIAVIYSAVFFPVSIAPGLGVCVVAVLLLTTLFSDRAFLASISLLIVVVSASYALEVSTFSISICEADVSVLGCRVLRDPSFLPSRSSSFPVAALWVGDGQGRLASAKGSIHVISPSTELYAWDEALLYGRIVDDGLFVADGVFLSSPSAFRSLRKNLSALVAGRLSSLSDGTSELALRLLLAYGYDGAFAISDMARKKGVSHVLALSGMHLEIVASAAGSMLFFVGDRKRKDMLLIVPLFLFSFLSAFGPSLLRAFISRALRSLFPSSGWELNLSCTFALHAVLSPCSLFSAGSVLSYLSIAAMHSAIRTHGECRPVRSVAITASCLAATMPYSFVTFGSYSLLAFVFSPVMSFLVRIFLGYLTIFLFLPLPGTVLEILYSLIRLVLSADIEDIPLGFAESYAVLLLVLATCHLATSKKIENAISSHLCGT